MASLKQSSGISLRTLARIAGVSVSTASRALHDHPVISAAVRKRIKALARRRGYAINPLVAQVYSQARSGHGFRHLGTLAYITAYDTADWWRAHPTLRGFHAGVMERAAQTGLGINEFWAHEPGLKGRRLTQILRARGIGGVVLAPVPGRNAADLLDWRHFSAALVGESVRTPRLNRAVPNQRHAVQLAIRELTALGYQRLGLVLRHRYHAMTDFNMLSAFLLLQHGLPASRRIPVEMPEEWTEQNFMTWYKRHRPDAIIGVVRPVREWLARSGVKCPDDVGLVLLDWDEESKQEFAAVDQTPPRSAAPRSISSSVKCGGTNAAFPPCRKPCSSTACGDPARARGWSEKPGCRNISPMKLHHRSPAFSTSSPISWPRGRQLWLMFAGPDALRSMEADPLLLTAGS